MSEYKLTKELNSIMEEARTLTASTLCASISSEAVVYFMAKKYIEASGKSDIECDILLPIFKGLPEGAQDSLLSDLEFEVKNYCKKNQYPNPSLYNSDNIILSEDLDRAFRRSKIEMSLDISYNKMVSDSDEINSLELFISILSERSYLSDILSDYKISKEAILTSYIARSEASKILNNTPDSKLDDMFSALSSMFSGLTDMDTKRNNPPKEQQLIDQSKDDEDFEKAGNDAGAISTKKVDPDSKTPTLDEFAFDMTKAAQENKYDPVIGRDKEIKQITEILCCRKKNNAILLGDPGSGKTAIVELLAQKIASHDVPRELERKRVLSLSTTDLTSGTMYRGQLEQRVQNLCLELKENRDIILYIDEFQQATSDNSTSIAQMLKPALGRGEITLIASTTTDEYRKFIEKDGALKRRFSPVQVGEPSLEETIEILKGIAPKYSEFHKVKCDPEVLIKCAEWSGKYINDRFFPDKAISVLDMSFSLAKLKNPSNTSKLEKIKSEVLSLQEKKKTLVLDDYNFEEAEVVRKEEEKAIKKLQKEQEVVNRVDPKTWPTLGLAEVSEVISKLSGVPIDKIMSSDMTKLKAIKTTLGEKVIGQEEAIEELTLALQRNVLGLRNPNKPIASFLLVGPTGTGKSYISKILSEEFMGSDKSLITIACSEYMQDWAESKLLGSAPGYVGFSDSEPRLYILKRKPYSVLLIDEVEKSSSNLYNIWLNMLEEGEITLSSGEKVSCRNTIIIFTGNVGTKNLELHGNGLGFGTPGAEDKKKTDLSIVMKEVKKEFRPEFLNRLTKIIVFNNLGTEELGKIFYLELKKLQDRLQESNGYTLKVSDKLKDLIVSKCEPQYGARSLQRLITTYIEDEICKTMLDVDITGKTEIEVDLAEEEKVCVEFK